MTTLITLLISILGYGTPADFSHMSEAELNNEIEMNSAQSAESDGGLGNTWEDPGVHAGAGE